MVDDSEREDFEQAIQGQGFDPDDFVLTEHGDQTGGEGMRPITGTVTIKRKSSGREKTYQAGHGSSWPAEFSDDLNEGTFE